MEKNEALNLSEVLNDDDVQTVKRVLLYTLLKNNNPVTITPEDITTALDDLETKLIRIEHHGTHFTAAITDRPPELRYLSGHA